MNRIYAGRRTETAARNRNSNLSPQIRSDQIRVARAVSSVVRAAAGASNGSRLAWSDVIRSGPPTQQCLANGR